MLKLNIPKPTTALLPFSSFVQCKESSCTLINFPFHFSLTFSFFFKLSLSLPLSLFHTIPISPSISPLLPLDTFNDSTGTVLLLCRGFFTRLSCHPKVQPHVCELPGSLACRLPRAKANIHLRGIGLTVDTKVLGCVRWTYREKKRETGRMCNCKTMQN